MCYSNERDEIELFAIDCFNDVTGMDGSCFTLHDVQSKAGKNTNPAKLGEELATLFENSVSEFSQYFATLTLFVGGVSPSVLQDPGLEEFGFHDMKPAAQKSVRDNLVQTCRDRHKGTFADKLTDDNVEDFLSRVRFVTSKADPKEYILSIACTTSSLFHDDRILTRIFTEIRDKQSALKNRPGIAGESIDRPDQVMDFGRLLRVRDIRLLVIERLLNRDFYKDEIPEDFKEYMRTLPVEEVEKEIVEDCTNELFTQYFDKNDRNAFWTLFDEIVTILEADQDADIQAVHARIDVQTLRACRHMTKRAHLYLIATIKDGLQK